jgi:hypothetical protein
MKKVKDNDAVDIEKVPARVASRIRLKTPRSLKPDEKTMNAYVMGQPEARAIINAWKFSFPIRKVSRGKFEEMEQKGRTVHGA